MKENFKNISENTRLNSVNSKKKKKKNEFVNNLYGWLKMFSVYLNCI